MLIDQLKEMSMNIKMIFLKEKFNIHLATINYSYFTLMKIKTNKHCLLLAKLIINKIIKRHMTPGESCFYKVYYFKN